MVKIFVFLLKLKKQCEKHEKYVKLNNNIYKVFYLYKYIH
jgi:hypothetical protein